jgi:dolichyl-phosphate beta-glucosyltransferase
VLSSSGALVLISDADLSTPIDEIEKLLPLISKECDIAIGSRGLPSSDIQVRQPWYREGMGKIFNTFVRLFVIGGIQDTQCGFKLFKGDVARRLFTASIITGFSFDVEILFLARKKGYTIKEIPVRWLNSPNSRVRLMRDPVFMLFDLIRIRMYWLLNKYT